MKYLALAVALLGSVAAVQTARAEDPQKITVGYLNLVNAQLVTKNLGLMQQEMPGVEIAYIKIGGGGDMLRAIAANQVDFGGLGNPPAAIGMTRDLPIRSIMVLNMLGAVEAMAVRSSAGIEALADVEGKTIAAPFGSTTHYLLLKALADEGIDPARMKLLDLSPSDIPVAWARGDIDAAWFWEPNLGKVVANGGEIFLTSAEMAARGYPTWDVGVVMNEFAEKHPDFVVKFLRAECAGIDYWLANPAETAAIIAEELSLPIEDATRMMEGTTMVPCLEQLTADYLGTPGAIGQFADTLENTAAFLVEQDRLPTLLSRDHFAARIDPSYLQTTLAE